MIKKILLVLTRDEKKRLGMLMATDIVISIADIVFLAFLLLIIRAYTDPAAARTGKLSFLSSWLTGRGSLLLIVGFFLLFSLKNLVGFLVYRAQCRFQFRVACRMSEGRLISHQEGDYAGFIDIDSSVRIREISYHPLEFCQHVLGGIQQIVTQVVLIVLAVAGIIFFNARLFVLILVILLPPVFVIFYLIKTKMRSVRGQARTSSEKSLQHLQEALSGFVESNIYDKNAVFLDRFLVYQQQYSRYLSNQTIVQGIPNRMIEIFALLGVVILIAVGSKAGNGGAGAFITIGVFMAAAYKIIPGVVKLLSLSGQINTYAFTLDNLAASAQAPHPTTRLPRLATLAFEAGDDSPDAPRAPLPRLVAIRSLQLRDIRFLYSGRPILDRLNFGIVRGDFAGIAGPSGKGKTTILNLILGFLTPDEGEIIINGAVTDADSRKACWPAISYVRQQSFLIHDTLQNNITLFDSPCNEQRLQEAITIAGLAPVIASFPEGLNQVIMENGRNISGGQRQRIAIARALYKDADLIILDEPFNELDEESELALIHYFRQLAVLGKMVILITHNRKSISFCNKVISLDDTTMLLKKTLDERPS